LNGGDFNLDRREMKPPNRGSVGERAALQKSRCRSSCFIVFPLR
jgi:hypothetical protein